MAAYHKHTDKKSRGADERHIGHRSHGRCDSGCGADPRAVSVHIDSTTEPKDDSNAQLSSWCRASASGQHEAQEETRLQGPSSLCAWLVRATVGSAGGYSNEKNPIVKTARHEGAP